MTRKFPFAALLVCTCAFFLCGFPAHASEVSLGAVLVGKVTFEGKPPPAQVRAVNKDPEACGHDARDFYRVRVDEDGALQDVVIYLDSQAPDVTWEHPSEGYVLNQKGCTFDPYILLYSKDRAAKLILANADPAMHNVRISQIIGRVNSTLLNMSIPKDTPPKAKTLRINKASKVLWVKCDAHDFMEAWIFAADNPYCVLVGEDGTYELPDLPPGDHVISAWHPFLGIRSAEITVTKGQQIVLDFQFAREK